MRITTTPPASWKQWRHCRDQNRDKHRAVLTRLQTSEKVLQRWDTCGDAAWVQRLEGSPHSLRVLCDKCRHRFCPACAREKAAIIRHNLTRLAELAGARLSLITLTLKHTNTPLREQLKRLVKAFRDCRRLKVWREAVTAAAWVIECKRGEDGLWHPHIHVLAEATYIRPDQLRTAWLASTHDSTVVHVKRISADHGASYIAKYVQNPGHKNLIDDSDLEEFFMAYRGQRTCATLGKWRLCPLAERADDECLLDANGCRQQERWITISSFEELLQQASTGDSYSNETLKLLGLPLFENARMTNGPPYDGP